MSIGYLLDVGVLLPESDDEYEYYSIVYDKKHSYFDENQSMFRKKELQKAIAIAKEYVENGVNNTYAIVTEQPIYTQEVEDADYSVDAIVFCCCKDDTGKIIENFMTVGKADE